MPFLGLILATISIPGGILLALFGFLGVTNGDASGLKGIQLGLSLVAVSACVLIFLSIRTKRRVRAKFAIEGEGSDIPVTDRAREDGETEVEHAASSVRSGGERGVKGAVPVGIVVFLLYLGYRYGHVLSDFYSGLSDDGQTKVIGSAVFFALLLSVQIMRKLLGGKEVQTSNLPTKEKEKTDSPGPTLRE
jgi:hypothetical protein